MSVVYTSNHPAYYQNPHHHQASAYPHLYQSSAYSLPLSTYPSRPYDVSPREEMPSYYVQSQPSSRSHHHHSSHSLSKSHSATGYPAQPVYYTSGTHRDYAYGDSGRHRRASSVGHGGHYYPSNYQSSGYYNQSPQYYPSSSGTRRRSYSTSRHHHTPTVIDARHSSSSHRRPSVSYGDAGHYHSHYHNEPIGDRVRRWFGLGPSHYHSGSGGRVEYTDARTGRPVDIRGRPVYRV